ncbi:helix-turn-helix transcriptional regulator [Tateyamaria sp. SN6-1]|uniref:helix-turn-helix transcriptional regulator n=1 Tax=Tateyamaria sp. SN6-1 TaxID=3092148 RepID=UPI0039F4D266
MADGLFDVIRSRVDTQHLWQTVSDYFRSHHIEKISYHHLSPDMQTGKSVTVQASGFSNAWTCHYIRRKLYLVDPITELAQSSTQAFRWSQINTLARLSAEQQKYLLDMDAAGVGDGLAFQVFGPGVRNGYVGLGVDDPQHFPDAAQVIEFQMVAQAAHLRYCELNPVGLEQGDLSPRERQILRWIARGKSNSTIADILSLSPHTVDTLVRRIFGKLGVADRTTAAVQGVGAGLIVP